MHERRDLNIPFVIIPIVWWFISILTSRESPLCMGMRPTIILQGLVRDLRILGLKLSILKKTSYYAMFPSCLLRTVLSIANSTGIMVAL